MTGLRPFVCAFAAALAFTAQAQNPSASRNLSSTVTNLALLLPPPLPQSQSPVNYFRQLLLLSPAERNAALNSLTNRTPEARARILAKVREYQLLGPNERELRLKATELRWWLTPLLRMAPAERAPRLAAVPEDLRELVTSRLQQWDILPPPLQQEFLANDRTLHYFARVETTNLPPNPAADPGLTAQVNQFFELTPAEKQQTLNTLSEAERAQMEKTLGAFEKLPVQQRSQCIRNYAKFAGMPPAERAEFLKNAESWSKMSPSERQTWRDLVTHIPQWPPLPMATVPHSLMPPDPAKSRRPSVATDQN